MYPEHYHPAANVARIVGLTIAGIIGAVVIAFLFGYFVMLLWNWLLPPLFHAGTINYWQAFGLVILAKILFGGMGGTYHDHGRRHRRDWGWGPEAWAWRHGRRAWKGPWRWEDYGADAWAPKGNYRNWRYYGRYWRDEGKAAFEAWLEKHGGEASDEEKDRSNGPGQPKAE